MFGRWNMSLEESDLQFRSLESIRSNSTYTGRNVHKRKGCKHPPLLDLEPQQLIIDELHLLLRVGDVLLRNVILQAHALDREHANFSGADTGCVGALQQLVRSCGVSFAIHEVRALKLQERVTSMLHIHNHRGEMLMENQLQALSSGRH